MGSNPAPIATSSIRTANWRGWRQRAQVRYYRNTEQSRQQLYYELELNKRNELVASDGGFSYEYSPTRHTLGGKYTHKFSGKWYLTGDLAYRVSDFPASATCLYSNNANRFMPTDRLADVGEYTSRKILNLID